MDPSISWLQPEQDGPAKELWLRLWQTQQDFDNMNVHNNGDSDSETLSQSSSVTNGKSSDLKNSFLRRRAGDNRGSTRGMNTNSEGLIGEFGGCPWRIPGFKYQRGIMGLHEEIEHFYKWIRPTRVEHSVRGDVIHRMEEIILSLWPDAKVQVFGSFRTGLYLPTSDIDIVVLGRWSNLPLRTLEKAFIEQDVADPSTIKVLDKASVPIIKLTDKKTEVKVDISFNMSNGLKSAELIKKFKQSFPVLTKLVYVLKQFLMERDLNEVFTGGISSYSLILMCISFLQLHPRQDTFRNSNLGVLLIEFFELYGRKFNYMQTGIRIRDGGSYINKEEMQKDMVDGHRPSLLCIEDPLTPSNDIGRSSYGVLQVKRAFDYAYSVLTYAVNPQNYHVNDCSRVTILGRIVRITDEVVRYRMNLSQTYRSMYQPDGPRIPSAVNRVACSLSSSGSTSSDESFELEGVEVSDGRPGDGGGGGGGGGGSINVNISNNVNARKSNPPSQVNAAVSNNQPYRPRWRKNAPHPNAPVNKRKRHGAPPTNPANTKPQ